MKAMNSPNKLKETEPPSSTLPADPEQILWAALAYAIISFGLLFVFFH